jgi:hypothetical protein
MVAGGDAIGGKTEVVQILTHDENGFGVSFANFGLDMVSHGKMQEGEPLKPGGIAQKGSEKNQKSFRAVPRTVAGKSDDPDTA